jgi:hypothetical protein
MQGNTVRRIGSASAAAYRRRMSRRIAAPRPISLKLEESMNAEGRCRQEKVKFEYLYLFIFCSQLVVLGTPFELVPFIGSNEYS